MSEQPQDHLFEEETKLEEGGISLRLIAIVFVIVAIGVGVGYFLVKQKKDLTAEDAAPVLTAALKAQGPASVHFHSGHVVPSVDEKPRDPHYRLLEKAGIVKLTPDKKSGGAFVAVTEVGEREISSLPEFKKWKNPDNTDAYAVPLAIRQLAQVTKVTMTGPNTARVEYVWKWAPTRVGEKFDASGALVKTFNSWERATLIKDYGVDFYSEPKRASAFMIRSDKGWKIGQEEE